MHVFNLILVENVLKQAPNVLEVTLASLYKLSYMSLDIGIQHTCTALWYALAFIVTR